MGVHEAGHEYEVAEVAPRHPLGNRRRVHDGNDAVSFHDDRGGPQPLFREHATADDGVGRHAASQGAGVGGRSFQLRIAFQTRRKSDSVW